MSNLTVFNFESNEILLMLKSQQESLNSQAETLINLQKQNELILAA